MRNRILKTFLDYVWPAVMLAMAFYFAPHHPRSWVFVAVCWGFVFGANLAMAAADRRTDRWRGLADRARNDANRSAATARSIAADYGALVDEHCELMSIASRGEVAGFESWAKNVFARRQALKTALDEPANDESTEPKEAA